MLKHATICRTSRVHLHPKRPNDAMGGQDHPDSPNDEFVEQPLSPLTSLIRNNSWLASRPNFASSSCSASPTPLSTPSHQMSSAPSSVFNSPSKSHYSNAPQEVQIKPTSSADSTIKIYAQTLSQDVEYVTLHVNTQTKSKQIVRSLLRKFRLKHRDPNLFYLTLERIIRKEGLKTKSIMLLGDEACPLQLQQCCSNPPHNDIKFTLQMHTGALMKIFCSDVCPNTRYKCLSLSTQTTVAETIELMVHCLNLHTSSSSSTCNTSQQPKTKPASSYDQQTQTQHSHHKHIRQSSSPAASSSDSCSASSTTSSSSGIDSDPTNNLLITSCHRQLNHSSRASSITSLSSSSNISNNSLLSTDNHQQSASQSYTELYCLVIECKDTSYRRILEVDECLVDVYQNLIDEARSQACVSGSSDLDVQHKKTSSETKLGNELHAITNLNSSGNELISQQADQWFVIKLKRCDTISPLNLDLIRTTNPHKQSMPLPPIPKSLSSQLNNPDELKHIVSTTQIELNHRPSISQASSHAIAPTPATNFSVKNPSAASTSVCTEINGGYSLPANKTIPNSNTRNNGSSSTTISANLAGYSLGVGNESSMTGLIADFNQQNLRMVERPMREEELIIAGEKAVAANEQSSPCQAAVIGGNSADRNCNNSPPIVGPKYNNNPFSDDTLHLYGNVEQIRQQHHLRQVSAVSELGGPVTSINACEPQRMPPPPASLIWLPPVRPRKRNLSNASSTFRRAQNQQTNNCLKITASSTLNRRRYDPIQLAKDLDSLDLSEQS